MDAVTEWLAVMGQEIGAPLELNEEGICAVECENNLTVVIESREESPVFHFSAPLLEIPGDQEAMLKLFAACLSLNLFLVETRGTTIALAEELHQIMLCFMEEKECCDETRFAAQFQGFYETALAIREKLEADRPPGDGACQETRAFIRV